MKLSEILVVEDDEVDFMGLSREFRKHKVDVPISRAIDGLEALEGLETRPQDKPVLVVLDLNLPRMNGLEFLKLIRSGSRLRNIPVMVLTTSRNTRDLERAYGLGIAVYLVKDELGSGFSEAIRLIKQYSDVVEFPG